MKNYVVLIACEDRPGLVHEITGVLFRRKVNVTENNEFVDHVNHRFFMRTQFEGEVATDDLVKELLQKLPPSTKDQTKDIQSHCDVRELKPRRLVVMASREPHCLGDLLLRHSTGELKAEILAVFSQHADCGTLTARFDIPFECIPVQGDRTEHESRILKSLQKYSPDYLVLARYMRIFSSSFVSNFRERIINIHHSFLPAFIGKDPYQQAYSRGVKIIGATAHFVTPDLDEGPIIMQNVIPVDHTDSPEMMSRRGQDIEKFVLSRGLSLVLEDRVLVDHNRTIVFT